MSHTSVSLEAKGSSGGSFGKLAESEPEIIYPESDGKPMADNTRQFEWIVTIKEGLGVMFGDRPDVFVAGDLLWYPVERKNKIRAARDAMVVFGRPKGRRGYYRQWTEGDIPPQVVFEIISPGNTPKEMKKKRGFYSRHGVEEYYQYDPDRIIFKGWKRSGKQLRPIPESKIQGWVSPRLGTRFEIIKDELVIFRPDGRKFLTFEETEARAEQAEAKTEKAEAKMEKAKIKAEQARTKAEKAEAKTEKARTKAKKAEAKAKKAEAKTEKAEAKMEKAKIKAEKAEAKAEKERQRAEMLEAKLKALGLL
ncbi:MAG: Uma2 family endonuclease [Deltaproteobacteria bacterium]|nr:MAG: Uma2 family endonuclease [Deltaproteobacteria bacterium]